MVTPTAGTPARRRWIGGRGGTALALGLILLIGVALRLYRLGDVPFGFHPDEGHNALDAYRIAHEGWRPVFLERNNGREPLFMYLMAGLVAAFGPSIWAVRLTAVAAGAAVILAQFAFVRSLPIARARRVALLSAFFVATTLWPVAQARYALRANLLPLWVALMLWAWGRVLAGDDERPGASRSRGFAVLTGVFVAGAVYTHLTGRLLPAVLILSALWVAFRGRRPRVLADLGIALAVALALALPQIHFFWARPEMLSYRADQVSVFNPEVNEGDLAGLLVENGWNLIKAPVWEGDTSWYHNLRRRPVFGDPLSALAFLAGALVFAAYLLGRSGRRVRDFALLLALALGVTAAPSWLSVGAPNYVRMTGTWPVLFLLPALGLDAVASRLARSRRLARARGHIAAWALVSLTLGTVLAGTIRGYFYDYAPREEVYAAFNGAAVERGYALARVRDAGPMYVSPALWQQSVIRFLMIRKPPRTFDARHGLVLPRGAGWEPLSASVRYAFDPVERDAADAFGARWPQADREDVRDNRGELSLVLFYLSNEAVGALVKDLQAASRIGAPVDFGARIALASLDYAPGTVAPGGALTVTLLWTAVAPTDTDKNLFVHLVSRPADRMVGQFDGPPLDGSYPTHTWNPGELVLQPITLTVAEDAPAGAAVLRLGWYDWRDGARLPIPGDADAAVELGEVVVAPAGPP